MKQRRTWLGLSLALLLPLLLALVLVQGCATTHKGPVTKLHFPPHHIVAGEKLPDALDSYDDKTLFERGVEFLDAGASEDARKYFTHLVREFPDSAYVRPAYYNLGASLMQLHRCEESLQQFDVYLSLLDPEQDAADSVDARFKQGVCLAELGRYKEVAELYDVMIMEPNLRLADRIEALVDSGVGHYMLGDPVTAEYRMREAIRIQRKAQQLERLESDYHIAQAHFYIGEIYRAQFADLRLTLPPPGEDQKNQMSDQLEQKCQRLLSAQYAYIRAIKIGNVGWASASGYKIGNMYEELYDDMVNMPVPDDLNQEQAALYIMEMKKRVRILIKKAMQVWERSLDMANRTGADNQWVRRTQTSLERLRALMQKDEREAQQYARQLSPAESTDTQAQSDAADVDSKVEDDDATSDKARPDEAISAEPISADASPADASPDDVNSVDSPSVDAGQDAAAAEDGGMNQDTGVDAGL